jgi:hypothetical protein
VAGAAGWHDGWATPAPAPGGLPARQGWLLLEPALGRLQVPTLVVLGTDVLFRRKRAYWLCGTIPGAAEVAEIQAQS